MSRTGLAIGIAASLLLHLVLLVPWWAGNPPPPVATASPPVPDVPLPTEPADAPAEAEARPDPEPLEDEDLFDPIVDAGGVADPGEVAPVAPEPVPEPAPEPVAEAKPEIPEPVEPVPQPTPASSTVAIPQESPQLAEETSIPDAEDGADQPPTVTTRLTGTRVGDPEAPHRPGLFIEWGDAEETLRALELGQMRLVIQEPPQRTEDGRLMHPKPKWELVYVDDQGWQRMRFRQQFGQRYANEQRIVQSDGQAVAEIFAQAARAVGLAAEDQLAVLVPADVYHLFQSRQMSAASRVGLTDEQISHYTGRFVLVGEDELDFQITGVAPRQATDG